MEKGATDSVWKFVTKYFCLTILGLATIFCMFLLVFPVVAPQKAATAYKNIGFGSVAVSIYERQYKKSNKIEDLYNLVLVCQQTDSGEKLLSYSSELLAREDFGSFETAFNEYALENADSDKLYLVASLRNYLNEIRIEYKYRKSPGKAFEDAVLCFENNVAEMFYFSKYVSCILEQNASLGSKKLMLAQTAQTIFYGKSILQLVKERYVAIKPDGDLNDANILRLEQLWQTKSVEVVLLEATDDAGLETAREELASLATIIEAKINND